MLKLSEITTDTAKARVSDTLQLIFGRGMDLSVRDGAESLGIPARTLQAYVEGERLLTLDAFLRLTYLPKSGVRLANRVLDLAGLEARPVRPGDPNVFHMNAALVSALHDLADMLADGRVDHVEEAVWKRLALDLAGMLIAHVNAREAGQR